LGSHLACKKISINDVVSDQFYWPGDLRPWQWQQSIQCPVLFLVGALDTEVLQLHQDVTRTLASRGKLITISGATHLFEEKGCLEQVAQLSADWFTHHLP